MKINAIAAVFLIANSVFSDAANADSDGYRGKSQRNVSDSANSTSLSTEEESIEQQRLIQKRIARLEKYFCTIADLNISGSYFSNFQLQQITKDRLIFRSLEHPEAISIPRKGWKGSFDEGAYIISGADYIGHTGYQKYRTAKGFTEEVETWIVLDGYIIDGKVFNLKIKPECPVDEEPPPPVLPFKIETQSIKLIPSMP